MGEVYRGLDESLGREVAVKILRAVGLGLGDGGARFRAERQILASLEHPAIARVVDGGTTEAGLPYLVMEYVDGRPITALCRERGLALEERLELFERVCDAVAFAHSHLVVHRDLKPSNILVETREDGSERAKILDFGLSKFSAIDGQAGAHRLYGVILPRRLDAKDRQKPVAHVSGDLPAVRCDRVRQVGQRPLHELQDLFRSRR